MPGHSSVPNHKSRSHAQGTGRCRPEGFRQGRTNSRDSATSQESYREHYNYQQESSREYQSVPPETHRNHYGSPMETYKESYREYHGTFQDSYRDHKTSSQEPYQNHHGVPQNVYRDHNSPGHDLYWDHRGTGQEASRERNVPNQEFSREQYCDRARTIDVQPSANPPPRYANGRGSESLGFIPGSAAAAPVAGGRACGSCSSMGWSGCRAFLCCVLTCGIYGNRQPCLPANESSTDNPPKSDPEPRRAGNLAISNPTCGVTMEPSKQAPQLPSSESFRYRDVYLAGKKVVYPANSEAPPRRSRNTGKGESQRPVSNTSVYSREDLDLDDMDDGGTDIDSLITKKLLELYKLHQIEQLAKCTSDQSFSRKTNEISDLINSIAQDYNLEEQEAECRLVHGVIRISTRKYRSRDALMPASTRRDGTLPDSGNETMTFTFSNEPEVQVSELTPSDELARKMRMHSGRSAYYSSSATDSSGAPLLC
ncbi:keratinocyte differentiation factor 1 isoform X2 [Hoplias malabaricus]|uniref:keratinocyte differentiation factor 1 isoform X2 n=1 Tax=Hoplias malabaricus TaxID=27720 RepID=UPI0034621CFD